MAFSKDGEQINYTLYFNWKFIWVKAGSATLKTVPSSYKGTPAYKTYLTTSTSKTVDRFFVMRDTLVSAFTDKLVPIYYRKGAREGKRYYVDEMWYTYDGGKVHTKIKHLDTDGKRTEEKYSFDQCVSDMLHSFQRIRNFNPAGWAEGHTETVRIAGGSEIVSAKIRYRGKKTVKGDDDKKYDCLVMSYMEKDGKKDKEIMRFFVTNDQRHIPVRIDMFLKFGTAKAFLKSVK